MPMLCTVKVWEDVVVTLSKTHVLVDHIAETANPTWFILTSMLDVLAGLYRTHFRACSHVFPAVESRGI